MNLTRLGHPDSSNRIVPKYSLDRGTSLTLPPRDEGRVRNKGPRSVAFSKAERGILPSETDWTLETAEHIEDLGYLTELTVLRLHRHQRLAIPDSDLQGSRLHRLG